MPTALALACPAAQAQSTTPTAPPPAGLFSRMVVFGDSFSDSGNFSIAAGYPEPSRFTTNPGLVAVEYIANYFSMPITPSLQGGSNYAFALASVHETPPDTPPFVPSLPDQLAMSLASSGGKADPHALYTIIGGANDVFNNFTLAGMELITPEQAMANLQADAQAELGMIQQLDQAGARYVMVVNLPDLGLSPDVVALGPEVAAQLTAMTAAYNATLEAGLDNTRINVIPVNLFALFNEFASQPARYGLSNVTDAACGVGALSVDCGPEGSGAPYTYAPGTENTYLFADFGHPGTAAHRMLAQYAQSIVIAPGQISLLAEAPLAMQASIQRTLQVQARLDDRDGNAGWRPWIDVSRTRQRLDAQVNSPASGNAGNVLSVGADLRPIPALAVGVALSSGRQRDTYASNAGGFRLTSRALTGYASWSNGRAYLGATGSVGQLRYRDILRNVPIGPDLRQEIGNTDGSHTTASIAGGWWFDVGSWKTGPFADLTWQRIRVDGYREAGNDSSAMQFGRQRRQSQVASLGWQLRGRVQAGNAILYPYARAAWHHDADADTRAVSAGLVGMAGTFALDGYTPDRTWGSLDLGLGCDFSSRLAGWVGYSGRFSDTSQRTNSLNLGLQLRF